MGAALLTGDLAGAFAANPGVLIGLGLLLVLAVLWGSAALGGPLVRPPACWVGVLRSVRPRVWLTLGALALALDVLLSHLR